MKNSKKILIVSIITLAIVVALGYALYPFYLRLKNLQKVSFPTYGTSMLIPYKIDGKKVIVQKVETPIGNELIYEGNDFKLEGDVYNPTGSADRAHYNCWGKENDGNQLPKEGEPFVVNPSSRDKLINWGFAKDDEGRGFFSFTTDKIYCQIHDGGPFKLAMFQIKID